MATDVTLPDMGEEVEDVTISRWLVKEGEDIRAGDPLLEIATDKVDTEVPSPVGGRVLSIRFGEGEIVDLDAVIAVIGEAAEAAEAASEDSGAEFTQDQSGRGERGDGPAQPPTEDTLEDQGAAVRATPVARRMAEEAGIALSAVQSGDGEQITKRDVEATLRETLSTGEKEPREALEEEIDSLEESTSTDSSMVPLEVRRLAAAYDIDLRMVAGGRAPGSLTRHDLIEYAKEQKGLSHLTDAANYDTAPQAAGRQPASDAVPKAATKNDTAPGQESAGETLVPHGRMRQIIARNMVQSAFSAPHVTTVHSVDMGTATAHYQAHKGEFAQQGVRLTLTAYIVAAVVEGLRAVPAANSEWKEEGLLLKHSFNIGMAVALPPDATGVGGLIVPVIRDAGDLNLVGIARHVADLAARARENQLAAADTQGGTFTLTNYGTSGSLFQTPVILQPQVAILGTGAIEKRPVVVSRAKPYEASVDDYLAFRPIMDLALSYDHRVLDGASADAFCLAVKNKLETWSEAA